MNNQDARGFEIDDIVAFNHTLCEGGCCKHCTVLGVVKDEVSFTNNNYIFVRVDFSDLLISLPMCDWVRLATEYEQFLYHIRGSKALIEEDLKPEENVQTW